MKLNFLRQSQNWLNLTLRFLLELSVLYIVGWWGFEHGEGFKAYALAVFLPVIMGVSWAVFRYPNDPKKNPVIPVGGKTRIVLEFCFFAFGVAALYDLGHSGRGSDLIFAIILHYLFSLDRLQTLFTNGVFIRKEIKL